MPHKRYTTAQKAEAVALAVIVGAEVAATELRIDERTVRAWCQRAGKGPADAINAADWGELADLARAKVQVLLTTGRLNPVHVATIAGITRRNAEAAERAGKPKTDESWSTRFDRWCDETFGDRSHLARRVPCHVLVFALQTSGHGPDEPDDRPLDDDAAYEWACGVVKAVGDLDAFVAEAERWQAEYLHAKRTISARAGVLHSSGMVYHEALAMARDLSDDVAPTPPAWASTEVAA